MTHNILQPTDDQCTRLQLMKEVLARSPKHLCLVPMYHINQEKCSISAGLNCLLCKVLLKLSLCSVHATLVC